MIHRSRSEPLSPSPRPRLIRSQRRLTRASTPSKIFPRRSLHVLNPIKPCAILLVQKAWLCWRSRFGPIGLREFIYLFFSFFFGIEKKTNKLTQSMLHLSLCSCTGAFARAKTPARKWWRFTRAHCPSPHRH